MEVFLANIMEGCTAIGDDDEEEEEEEEEDKGAGVVVGGMDAGTLLLPETTS